MSNVYIIWASSDNFVLEKKLNISCFSSSAEWKNSIEQAVQFAQSVDYTTLQKISKKEQSTTDLDTTDLEKELLSEGNSEDSFSEEKINGLPVITYEPPLDYMELWSYAPSSKNNASYEQEHSEMSDTTSDMLSISEAEEIYQDIQYAAALGTLNDIDDRERRRFSLWVTFNKGLFSLFESFYSLTREVNYTVY